MSRQERAEILTGQRVLALGSSILVSSSTLVTGFTEENEIYLNRSFFFAGIGADGAVVYRNSYLLSVSKLEDQSVGSMGVTTDHHRLSEAFYNLYGVQ